MSGKWCQAEKRADFGSKDPEFRYNYGEIQEILGTLGAKEGLKLGHFKWLIPAPDLHTAAGSIRSTIY